MTDEADRTPPEGADQPAEPAAAAPAQADDAAGLREQLLRAKADFQNALKRHGREMEAYRRYAIAEFVRNLLPGLDDLERALDHAAAAEAADTVALRHGVEMAYQSLLKALRDAGVERVPAAGEPFDPAVHEAVTVEASTDVDRPTVAAELRGGYALGDRLLRPAQVRVSMPAGPGQEEGADDE